MYLTAAQRKARINRFIKTYEERIESYKLKYGENSRTFIGKRYALSLRIKDWRKELETVKSNTRSNRTPIILFIIKKTSEYFQEPILGCGKRGVKFFVNDKGKFFICKYLIENKLFDTTNNHLQISNESVRRRREEVTHWIGVLNKNREEYKQYKNFIDETLKTAEATQ